MKPLHYGFSLVFFFLLSCTSAPAQVEQVFSDIVKDQSSFVAALDEWLSSRDAKDGQKTTLLSNVVNGDSTNTHLTVLDFPDYATWQAHMDRTAKSSDFAKYQLRSSGASTISEGLYLHVADNGKTWSAGDYLYIMGVNVTGTEFAFTAALKEMLNSELSKKVRA